MVQQLCVVVNVGFGKRHSRVELSRCNGPLFNSVVIFTHPNANYAEGNSRAISKIPLNLQDSIIHRN